MFRPLVAMFKRQTSISKEIPYISFYYSIIEGTSDWWLSGGQGPTWAVEPRSK
jgi:hypothetical protein